MRISPFLGLEMAEVLSSEHGGGPHTLGPGVHVQTKEVTADMCPLLIAQHINIPLSLNILLSLLAHGMSWPEADLCRKFEAMCRNKIISVQRCWVESI